MRNSKEPFCPNCNGGRLQVYFMSGKTHKDYCCLGCFTSFSFSVVRQKFMRLTKLEKKEIVERTKKFQYE